MKLVYTSEDLIFLYHLKNILEARDIDCVIKNERLASLAGEIPLTQCWPELWVKDDLNASYAAELIKTAKQISKNTSETWVCDNCGEEHTIQFTDCWNCQNIKAF